MTVLRKTSFLGVFAWFLSRGGLEARVREEVEHRIRKGSFRRLGLAVTAVTLFTKVGPMKF